MADTVWCRDLEALLDADLTVRSVEFGRVGSRFDCILRRNKPVHVIQGDGATVSDALRAALLHYREQAA